MVKKLVHVSRAWVKCPKKQYRLILKESCKSCDARKECDPETIRRPTKVVNWRYLRQQEQDGED